MRSFANSDLTKAALCRLEKVLDEENAALAAFTLPNLAEYSRVKTQSLLELQRLAAAAGREGIVPELMQQLKDLRQKLDLNRWLLHIHLEAAKEVTSVITSAIREAESDGTYSRASGNRKALS